MDIFVKDVTAYKDFSDSECEIHCIHVVIDDVSAAIEEFKNIVSDTSWIGDLDELSQLTFSATAARTIDNIVNEIIGGMTSEINSDIGEYIVSYSAQSALETQLGHIKIPLAELLKEKIGGNPGFDFHTISEKRFLIFGEAKYSADETPRGIAVNQIGDFIGLSKDYAELNSFRAFLDVDIQKNMIDGRRGYAAAFSFNADNIDTIFKNAVESEKFNELICHVQLYLLAIEFRHA